MDLTPASTLSGSSDPSRDGKLATSTMMGQPLPLPPPPIPPPPLPSFLMEEEQPHRGEDYDLLGWARSLSVSPRMFPTYGAPSGLENSTFASYKGIGEASPMSSRKELSVGTGLSPMLGPTHIGVSSGAGGGGMLMASGQGDAYDYSSFGQYHTNAPDGTPHHHSLSTTLAHSPLRQHSNMSQSQSFSNVAASTRHISPKTISTHQLHHSPPLNSIPRVNPTPLPSSRTVNHNMSLASPSSHGLPGEEEEDPRIRAYAKLEFPTFDIYIQKLSVIVGRRPAATVAPAAVSPTPGNGLSGTAFDGAGSLPGDVELEKSEVKLEDFFIGMEDDKKQRLDEVDEPKIKMEEPSAAPGFLLTPSSPQAMEAAPEARDFSEFLKSSPPSPVSRTLPLAEGAVNQALEPTFAPEPLEEKPTSEIAVETAQSSSVSAEATPTIASDSLAFDLKPLDVPTPFVDSVGALPLEDSNLLPFDPNHSFASAPPPILTDIDLGPIRAVSRQHARLYFDYELGGWAIEVLGRNGVVVEGTWKAKGEIEILSKRLVETLYTMVVKQANFRKFSTELKFKLRSVSSSSFCQAWIHPRMETLPFPLVMTVFPPLLVITPTVIHQVCRNYHQTATVISVRHSQPLRRPYPIHHVSHYLAPTGRCRNHRLFLLFVLRVPGLTLQSRARATSRSLLLLELPRKALFTEKHMLYRHLHTVKLLLANRRQLLEERRKEREKRRVPRLESER